ncbi:MAG: glycosyltransferase family 2 protein [Actinomycetales bacterium]|nr:glycosyltransferase family 2 protein [Actinomycetales bacterium]
MTTYEAKVPELRLTIAYSTLADRVANIKLPQVRADQEVLVIVQNPEQIEYQSVQPRADLRIIELTSSGVAKSRNVALEHANGQYLVFADDDIEFDLAALDEVIEHLENCSCSLVLGQASDLVGQLRKSYPSEIQWLTRFNSARAATYEMLVDLVAVRNAGIRFDEYFGAGVENYLGDEYIFICDLLDKNLRAHALPIVMAKHPVESSGSGWGNSKDLQARSLVFSRIFGPAAFVVRAAFIWRNRDKVNGLSHYLRFIFAKF